MTGNLKRTFFDRFSLCKIHANICLHNCESFALAKSVPNFINITGKSGASKLLQNLCQYYLT